MDANMSEQATVGAMLQQWSDARARAERERDRLAREVEGYSQMIDGLLKIHPELAKTPPFPAAVRGVEVQPRRRSSPALDNVVRALTHPDWMMVRDVVRVLAARGELPNAGNPEAAVRAALRRAAADGLIEKGERDGRTTQYRALSPTDTKAPAVTGAFEVSDQLVDGGETDQDEAPLRDYRDYPAGWHGNDQHRSVVAN